jgi:C4-dicarboxylate-specific signal transduction histidine kinase
MPNAVHETSAVTATAASDSERRCHETQTELASANPVAILGQLSASIAEINQPISAVVMNAEAALQLLLAQPTDTEAIRQLLACIVKDGMRTGDIANRTRALINRKRADQSLRAGEQRLLDVQMRWHTQRP